MSSWQSGQIWTIRYASGRHTLLKTILGQPRSYVDGSSLISHVTRAVIQFTLLRQMFFWILRPKAGLNAKYLYEINYTVLQCVSSCSHSRQFCMPFNGHIKSAEQRTLYSNSMVWYTGRWWVACYIWYSEEGPEWAAVPNVTAHSSKDSVSTSYYSMWHCLCTLKR